MKASVKKELLKIVNNRINKSGVGYVENYPEDDIEGRREWDSLHEEWSTAIYGLFEIRDYLNTIKEDKK